jgi:hypothetical protein
MEETRWPVVVGILTLSNYIIDIPRVLLGLVQALLPLIPSSPEFKMSTPGQDAKFFQRGKIEVHYIIH